MEAGGWEGGVKAAGKLGPFIYFIAKQSIMAQIWCVCVGGGVDVEMGTYERSFLMASNFSMMPEA